MGFFQDLIDNQLSSGAITVAEAEVIRKVFSMMPEVQRLEAQNVLTKYPHLIPLIIANVLQKVKAVDSGSLDEWEKVVADQAKKLDELAKNHAES